MRSHIDTNSTCLRKGISSQKILLAFFSTIIMSADSWALRNPDMSGDDAGAIAVYSFGESGGDITYDSAANPLNLQMSTAGNLTPEPGTTILTNAFLNDGMLLINPKPNNGDLGYQSAQRHRTFLTSNVAASKINSCNAGFTIQVFLRPWFPFQGSMNDGNLIVGLSNSEGSATVLQPNIGLYQTGMTGAEAAMLKVRDGNNTADSVTSIPNAFSSVREGDNPGRLTEIIATQEPSGILTVYVNRIPRSSLQVTNPVFLPTAKLVIGNELVQLTTRTENGNIVANTDQQRNWSGEIYHLAIYCQGVTKTDILGTVYENKASIDVVAPDPSVVIDANRIEARKMMERLTGTLIPIDHPMVTRVAQRIAANDRLGAAKIITGDQTSGEAGHPEFLNTIVKQMAMKMSNREETIRAPFNDFAASFVGVTRDERNAKELLTGDFFYMAHPDRAAVRRDIFRDILVSNNHYADIESGRWDLGKVLVRVPGPDAPAGAPTGQQLAREVTGSIIPNPDPAGVLTSRAFMAAHATAGTNRRLVEYTLREFLCIPISEAADTSASPARIGRDIDRLPGGDQTKFETSCKGCHTVMDGMRGAFAKFDFRSVTISNTRYDFVINTQIHREGVDFGFPANAVDEFGTVRKMNHNETTFPNGYTITDDSFVNNALGTNNRAIFGWNGSNRYGGVGVNQFGRMVADSDRFAQCMAKRAFTAVCTPDLEVNSFMPPAMVELGRKFKDSGYNLRALFQEVAIHPACLQNMGR